MCCGTFALSFQLLRAGLAPSLAELAYVKMAVRHPHWARMRSKGLLPGCLTRGDTPVSLGHSWHFYHDNVAVGTPTHPQACSRFKGDLFSSAVPAPRWVLAPHSEGLDDTQHELSIGRPSLIHLTLFGNLVREGLPLSPFCRWQNSGLGR